MADFQLDPEQLDAVDLIENAEFGVVTGGPGVGKTTCLKEAIANVDEPVYLIAPTGKAAVRMKEATGRDAMTMHRFLGWKGGDEFRRVGLKGDPLEPLGRCLIVVDEASMVDVKLAAALFRAAPEARIVFVGDVDQLPSVGPGNVLGDIIASGAAEVVRLETLHRAAQENWVCRNAQKFNRGEMVELEATPGIDDFLFRALESADHAPRDASAILRDWDYENDGSIQLLIPQRPGPAGIWKVNHVVQERLNPTTSAADRWDVKGRGREPDFTLRVGDRVINKRNNYTVNVMNGEMGTVVSVPYVGQNPQSVGVAFDSHADPVTGRTEAVPIPVFDLKLGYAITIHGAQGSEWDWVGVVCHSSHGRMLSRRLIYTAITRAKKGVVLIGDVEGLERAAANTDDGQRKTRLKTMLMKGAA